MFRRLSGILSKLESDFISNPNYLLLLVVFNCSLLMNFEELVWQSPTLLCIMFLMCFFSFLNYRFWWATMVNIIISFCYYAENFPVLPNHSNLEFFADSILLGMFLYKLSRPNLRIDANLVSWVFRICVVSVYFYTGFHKLNTDFFNPCVSCVNKINSGTIANLTGRPFKITPVLSSFFQYATIFIEMALPFGLFWKKTRRYSALAMIGFHFYLSLTVFADFSSFAAFLILGCIINFNNTPKNIVYKALKCYVFFALLYMLLLVAFMKLQLSSVVSGFISGTVFGVGYLIFFFIFIKNYTAGTTIFKKKYIKTVSVCILTISFWTMKSYVGLGNSSNLTMFSNLITEKSRSNHLLIDTKKTKIFDLEEDNLLIFKLDERLKTAKLEGFRLPITQFKFLASQWIKKPNRENLACTLVYKNDTIVINDLSKSEFSKTKWWYKYISFRKIQPEGANECYW
ncbi:MAG: HTTM domain-containing protein [Flavobacterium sp.]|nr:HTTM domain-containing protein [Flavobacterium sp.]